MPYVAIVTVLALLQLIVFGVLVGRARARFGVHAPTSSGHPEFDRYFRVQMNTLEQLVLFLPAMWIFAYFVSPSWAAVAGAVFSSAARSMQLPTFATRRAAPWDSR